MTESYAVQEKLHEQGFTRITAFSFWHPPKEYFTNDDVDEVAFNLRNSQYKIAVDSPDDWTPGIPAEFPQ